MSITRAIQSSDISDHILSPYSRIFALELQQTDYTIKTKGALHAELIIPSGERISRIYSCGALTEINRGANGGGLIRIADPTGVLVLYIKSRNPETEAMIDSLSTPAFISVTATIESDPNKEDGGFRLILETIHPSDRSDRDRWIIWTAERTLDRLKSVCTVISGNEGTEDQKKAISNYKTSNKQLKFLAGMVEKALNHILDKPVAGDNTEETKEEYKIDDTGARIINLIRQHSGPKGVSIQELITFAQKAGISESILLDSIRVLITEDELYQPAAGFIKIL
jgi:hypothetical protein